MTKTLATSQHILYLSRHPFHPRPQRRSYALRPGSLGSVPDIRAPPTKSMRVLIKEATESSLIPNEMGLAPGWCLQLSLNRLHTGLTHPRYNSNARMEQKTVSLLIA